ncbi:hypothetical protein JCM6882_009417 [Rhodosporidiobolus microsporus]
MSDTEDHAQEPTAEQPAENAFPDIFGDNDSELSDLEPSDDEQDKASASSAPRRSPSPSASRSASPQRSASPEAAPSDAGDGDEYQEDALKRVGKIKKKKRAPGEEVEDEGERPKKKKKAAPRKKRTEEVEPEPESEEELDPEARRRKDLSKRLTEIVKKPTGKGKKKKAQDEEDLEMLNDEAVAKMRSSMMTACDQDLEENELGRPAVHKLRLLPQVVEIMQKTALAETIVENGMLEAVKRWLEPLPDRSLPALNIQRPLFNLLRTITIETSALKSSGLGKIVYFYTKCKRVDPAVARVANQLVSDWMRPILRRSKAFVDRDLTSGYGGASHAAALTASRKIESEAGGSEATASRHARIPQAMTATFVNAPRSGGGSGGQGGSMPGSGSGARMREFKKKLVDAKVAARRV